jgi:hypothetical protein
MVVNDELEEWPLLLAWWLHGGTQENLETPENVLCPCRDSNKVPPEHIRSVTAPAFLFG